MAQVDLLDQVVVVLVLDLLVVLGLVVPILEVAAVVVETMVLQLLVEMV